MIREHFTTTKYGTDEAARAACLARRRELKAAGMKVTYKKVDFTDLARCRDFILEAREV